MKKILFILICAMVLVSCSSDDDSNTPKKLYTQEGWVAEEELNLNLDDFVKYRVSVTDDKDYFVGVKNSNYTLVAGIYDKTKGLGKTYNDEEIFPKQIKLNKDYGEYSILDLEDIGFYNIFPHNNDIILQPMIWYGNNYETRYYKLIRYDGNNFISLPKKELTNNNHIYNWYGNSIAVSQRAYVEKTRDYKNQIHYKTTIYSDALDSLTSFGMINELDTSRQFPVYYDETIDFPDVYEDSIGNNIVRYNYTRQEDVWKSQNFNIKYNLLRDARTTFIIDDKSKNIWQCTLHVVNRDGTTKDIKFSLDINTGEIK